MFGSLLKIVTLPLDVGNVMLDIASGGDGSKESRANTLVVGDLEAARDEIAETLDQ